MSKKNGFFVLRLTPCVLRLRVNAMPYALCALLFLRTTNHVVNGNGLLFFTPDALRFTPYDRELTPCALRYAPCEKLVAIEK